MQSPLITPLLLFILLESSFLDAFNITQILSGHPEFSTFNNYLTNTQLVPEINSGQTITVLAVDDAAMGKLPTTPSDAMKKIMSIHVLLDYYDPAKLKSLSSKTTLVTTLFQASGFATNQQGFVNITLMPNKDVKFGSATPGSNPSAGLVKSVAAEPFNISVLQISAAIVPDGIASVTPPTSGPPVPSIMAPTPSITRPPSVAPTLSPGAGSGANAPSLSPGADSPTAADAPTLSPGAGSPAGAPSMSGSPPLLSPAPSLSPASEAPADDGTPKSSAMTNDVFNIVGGLIAATFTLAVLARS